MTDRYTIVRIAPELFVYDTFTRTTLPDAISESEPTAQQHAVRVVNKLNREHSEQEARHACVGEADALSPVSRMQADV